MFEKKINNIDKYTIYKKDSDVFHSYRAEKDTAGRNCAFIMLK